MVGKRKFEDIITYQANIKFHLAFLSVTLINKLIFIIIIYYKVRNYEQKSRNVQVFINVSKVQRRIATGRSFSIRLSPRSLSHPLSRAISKQVFQCFTGDIIYARCTHGLAKSSVFHFTLRSPRCERYRGDDARRRLRASIYFPRRSLHKSAARIFSISC